MPNHYHENENRGSDSFSTKVTYTLKKKDGMEKNGKWDFHIVEKRLPVNHSIAKYICFYAFLIVYQFFPVFFSNCWAIWTFIFCVNSFF